MRQRRVLLAIAGLAAVVFAGVVVLGSDAEELGPVRQSTVPGYPSRGDAIRDRELLEGALDAWQSAYDSDDQSDVVPNGDIEVLWAGRHGDGRLVVLHDGGDIAAVRHRGGTWSVNVDDVGRSAAALRADRDIWVLSTSMPGGLDVVELDGTDAVGRTRPASVTDGLLTVDEVVRTAVVPPADTGMVHFLVGRASREFVAPVAAAGGDWRELRAALTAPETARAAHAALAEGAAVHADEVLVGTPGMEAELAWRGPLPGGWRGVAVTVFWDTRPVTVLGYSRGGSDFTAVLNDPNRPAGSLEEGPPEPTLAAGWVTDEEEGRHDPWLVAFGDREVARLRILVGGRTRRVSGRSAVLEMEDGGDLPPVTVVGFTRDGTVVPAG